MTSEADVFDTLKYQVSVNETGTRIYTHNGRIHRTDGPAVIATNGTRKWLIDGQLHRTDGPAVIWSSGAKEWWQNGQLHREDGPAIEWSNGAKQWFLHGDECHEELFNELRDLRHTSHMLL